jgi:prevent-host-death family protein
MTIYVPIKQAKDRLSELIHKVEGGEHVVVTRNGRSVVDLIPHKPAGGLNLQGYRLWLEERGYDAFVGEPSADFDDPLPEDFLNTPQPPEFWDGPRK